MEFSAVILAGGKSSRMGCDKAWIEYQGRPLLAHQIQTLLQLRPAELFISAANTDKVGELGFPVLQDNFPGQGPLAGIEKALATMRFELLLVLAVDMPCMLPDTLRWLARQAGQGGIIPEINGRMEPLAACYPKTAHPILRAALGQNQNRASAFARQCVALSLASAVAVPAACEAHFANWNCPGDLPSNLPGSAINLVLSQGESLPSSP